MKVIQSLLPCMLWRHFQMSWFGFRFHINECYWLTPVLRIDFKVLFLASIVPHVEFYDLQIRTRWSCPQPTRGAGVTAFLRLRAPGSRLRNTLPSVLDLPGQSGLLKTHLFTLKFNCPWFSYVFCSPALCYCLSLFYLNCPFVSPAFLLYHCCTLLCIVFTAQLFGQLL